MGSRAAPARGAPRGDVRQGSGRAGSASGRHREREDARGDLMRDRQRLSKRLRLRHGSCTRDGRRGPPMSHGWAPATSPGPGADALPCRARVGADRPAGRADSTRRSSMAAHSQFTPVARRLSCLGVSRRCIRARVRGRRLVAVTGVTIGSFVRLVPASSPLGRPGCRGAIAKIGNSHARWLLGRGRLPPPGESSARGVDAAQVEPGFRGRPGEGRPEQPAPEGPLSYRHQRRKPRDRQRRPRARRLVLVAAVMDQ